VPKSANGKILREEGASATHSTEARAAVATVV
jgi:hypothetical protein